MYNLESKVQQPVVACSSMLVEELPEEHKSNTKNSK